MIIRNVQVGSITGDVFVEDGRFSETAPGEEIDATGLTMLPGLIDVHVHFNEPGRTDWEGAATGSRALAAGGGTTFFDMPLNSSPCTVDAAAFHAKRTALEAGSVTDFALWGGIVPGNRGELAELAALGAIGFKAFMADSGLPEFPRSDDLTLLRGMEEAARLGLPVAVHAETNELVHPPSGDTVRDYLDSRPVLAEVTAIRRAIELAEETGAKLHIVHISSGRGVLAALEGRQRGVDVTIETCAHYLYFGADDMERLGAVLKCAPPLRDASERKVLWRAVTRGDIDIVASDHSPALPSMKQDADFFRIWGGIAGVQSTLAVLLDIAAPERVAALTAANPAARFGLARKGRIETGYDADFTLVDLNVEYTVTRESLFQRHGFSPYVGATFRGVVRRTVVRGRTVYQDGKIAAEGGGRFVHAEPRTHT
ncbi:MAG TPA: allantoinase AllB [Candidatus Solibacter sp.]|nr:allantoinase AllB [Candidatus Solibacter sp.]